jgi:hypothetical protein
MGRGIMGQVKAGYISCSVDHRIDDKQAEAITEAVTGHGLSVLSALGRNGHVKVEFSTDITIEIPAGPDVISDCADIMQEAAKAAGIMPSRIHISIRERFSE